MMFYTLFFFLNSVYNYNKLKSSVASRVKLVALRYSQKKIKKKKKKPKPKSLS